MTPKIVVVGSANTDFVLTMSELPSRGETVLCDQFRAVRGGMGAAQPSLPSTQELEQFLVLSAPGPNPAIPDAVDLSNQAETLL